MVARVLLAFALTVAALPATAGTPATVAVAGVGFVTDFADIERQFPFTNRALKDLAAEGMSVEQALIRRLAGVSNSSFRLEAQELLDLDKSDAGLAVALGIDRETISVERIGDDYKLLVSVSAQAVFFDFKAMAIISARPVVVEYVDVLKAQPAQRDALAIVRRLLGSEPGQASVGGSRASLLDAVATAVADTQLAAAGGCRFAVREVVLSPRARRVALAMAGNSEEDAQRVVAQDFGTWIARNQRACVLPRTKGQVIGNKMAMRFANGEVFNLQIPEPDFVFDLSLDGFSKTQHAKSESSSTVIYGVFVGVKLVEPLSGKVLSTLDLKQGATKVVPASQVVVDDVAAFHSALDDLMKETTAAFSEPTEEWAKIHSDAKDARKQLGAAQGTFKKCN